MSPVKPANTNGGKLKIVLKLCAAKGQLILKCPFGVFKSPKKTTKTGLLPYSLKRGQIRKIRTLRCFLEDLKTPKGHFEIN